MLRIIFHFILLVLARIIAILIQEIFSDFHRPCIYCKTCETYAKTLTAFRRYSENASADDDYDDDGDGKNDMYIYIYICVCDNLRGVLMIKKQEERWEGGR